MLGVLDIHRELTRRSKGVRLVLWGRRPLDSSFYMFIWIARILTTCFPQLTRLYGPHGLLQLWSRSIGLCWRQRDFAATIDSPAEKFCANWLRPSTTLHRVNNPYEIHPYLMLSAGSRRSVHVIAYTDFQRHDDVGLWTWELVVIFDHTALCARHSPHRRE